MTIEISEKAEVFELTQKELPENWMEKPYPGTLIDYTKQFIESGRQLMQVPSAQSYREYNFLINVRHADFHKQVKLIDVAEEPFDNRLK